jgi:hypothetical protein
MADSPTPSSNNSQQRGRAERAVTYGRSTAAGRNLMAIGLIVALSAAAVAIFAKNDDGRPDYLNPATPTTSVRLVPPPTIIGDLFPPTTKGPDITIPPRTSVATDSTDDGLNPLGGDDPEDKLMPDVVCMNLQDAQDEIQDHGVFFSKSEDATGEGRRQIRDSNWIVVAQEPEPGEPVGEREAVLSVVKTDEPNDCDG